MPADFASLTLAPGLCAAALDLGYVHPTPIQAASIPALLAGRDLIGQSRTGSGKTAAFALPILQRLDPGTRGVQALVLCPTRELSAQVAREFRKLGRGLAGLAVLELVGGRPLRFQKQALARGVQIAIGTPGRVLELLQRGSLESGAVATLVLDEADRMLDMGFASDVERILASLPESRQTVLFSATFPDSIASMSAAHQRDAVRVTLELPEVAAATVRQYQLAAPAEAGFEALCRLLHEFPHEAALVFCNFKATVAELTARLVGAGISADRLDGDLDQFQRDQVLARFRNQSVRVLVATDVAGRGIDVAGLDLVINYELPARPEVYLHRIGRTGRAGRSGVAISLTRSGDAARFAEIERSTGRAIPRLEARVGDAASNERLLRSLARPAAMTTLLISGGRKHKLRAGDILGALTGDAGGLRGDEVGAIELHERLCYVAVATGASRHAVERLNAGRIKGRKFRATIAAAAPVDAAAIGRS